MQYELPLLYWPGKFMLEQRWHNGSKASFMVAANKNTSIHHRGSSCSSPCDYCIHALSVYVWLGLDRFWKGGEQGNDNHNYSCDYYSDSCDYRGYRTTTCKNTLGLVRVTWS